MNFSFPSLPFWGSTALKSPHHPHLEHFTLAEVTPRQIRRMDFDTARDFIVMDNNDPHNLLRGPIHQVNKFDRISREVLDRQQALLEVTGLGLASVQTGDRYARFIVRPHPNHAISTKADRKIGTLQISNPVILQVSDEFVNGDENCLSVNYLQHNKIFVNIPAPIWLLLGYQDPYGAPRSVHLEGMMARAAWHELRHLGLNPTHPERRLIADWLYDRPSSVGVKTPEANLTISKINELVRIRGYNVIPTGFIEKKFPTPKGQPAEMTDLLKALEEKTGEKNGGTDNTR